MKFKGPTNPNTQALIQILKKAEQPDIWRKVAGLLSTPVRKRRVVNVDQLNTVINDGDVVVIPSKVLGSGTISKKVTVGALNFSTDAKRKIISAGGTTLTIAELWEKHPKGTNVRLLK
jgi:large subunit ribosomal protein L18e